MKNSWGSIFPAKFKEIQIDGKSLNLYRLKYKHVSVFRAIFEPLLGQAHNFFTATTKTRSIVQETIKNADGSGSEFAGVKSEYINEARDSIQQIAKMLSGYLDDDGIATSIGTIVVYSIKDEFKDGFPEGIEAASFVREMEIAQVVDLMEQIWIYNKEGSAPLKKLMEAISGMTFWKKLSSKSQLPDSPPMSSSNSESTKSSESSKSSTDAELSVV